MVQMGQKFAEVYVEHNSRQHGERPDSCKNSPAIFANTEGVCDH